jgi:hypothetical protein
MDDEAGLKDFLSDALLSKDTTNEEVEFLRALRVKGRRPNAIFSTIVHCKI